MDTTRAARAARTARDARPARAARVVPADLVGTWQLLSYVDVGEDGTSSTGPLGDDPRGRLCYGPDGYLSVHMMRPFDEEVPPGGERYMGYAGTWRLDGAVLRHAVVVSSHRHMVGTEQVREYELDGDRLTLSGVAMVAGRPRRRVLVWRRLPPATPAGVG